MTQKIKKYLDSRLYKIFVVFYLIFVSAVVGFSADIFGSFRSFTNESNSMNPAIDKGSITIVKSFLQYEIGDAVAYYAKIDGRERIITHRITGIGGNVYITKGDANAVADRELVKHRLIIGKVIFVIPYAGYAITFAKSLPGTWMCIIVPAFIIVASELARIIFEILRRDQSSRFDASNF